AILEGADANTIGGATAAHRNILSGNTAFGVRVNGQNTGVKADNNVIRNNWIGPDANGTSSLANLAAGIGVDDFSNATLVLSHVIAGNQNEVALTGTQNTSTSISGNLIGIAPDGTTAMPGSQSGILITDAKNTKIGGTNAADANTLANNPNNGVTIT